MVIGYEANVVLRSLHSHKQQSENDSGREDPIYSANEVLRNKLEGM